MSLNNLGNRYSETGDYDQAKAHYLEALDIYRHLKLYGRIFEVLPRCINAGIQTSGSVVNYAALFGDERQLEFPPDDN